MVSITLLGQPISTNNCYYHAGRGLTFIKPKAKKLKESYTQQIRKQYKNKPLTKNLSIEVILYFRDKRSRDWDNFHKLSQDSLNKIVWVDDSQIQKATVTKFIDKNNPRIEYKIYEEKIKQTQRD